MSSSRSGKRKAVKKVVAVALTWDGARWPIRSLSPKARAFLADKMGNWSTPSPKIVSKLMGDDQVREIRICWVPQIKGGHPVLSEPFVTPNGKRIGFRAVKTARFGDVLGVVYRRMSQKTSISTNVPL